MPITESKEVLFQMLYNYLKAAPHYQVLEAGRVVELRLIKRGYTLNEFVSWTLQLENKHQPQQ